MAPAIDVVEPSSTDEVQAIVRRCAKEGTTIVPMGGGSNVIGALHADRPALYLSLRSMNRVDEIDADNCTVTCEAGIVGGELEEQLSSEGLTCGHYPQSLHLSTVGGWVATRALGSFSGRYGGIEDSLLALEVILPDGTLVRTPAAARVVAGPALASLFVGAEGTLGVVTRTTLRVSRAPTHSTFGSCILPNLEAALTAARTLIQSGVRPALLRVYDPAGSAALPGTARFPGGCAVLYGFEGVRTIVESQIEHVSAVLEEFQGQSIASVVQEWLATRFEVPSFLSRITEAGFIGDAIDVTAWWSQAASAHEAISSAIIAAGATCCRAHFSHFYEQGTSIYFIFEVEVNSDAEASDRYRAIWSAVMEACLAKGVAITHHHGVGSVRQPWFERSAATSTDLLARLRKAIDPAGIMNPHNLNPRLSQTWLEWTL